MKGFIKNSFFIFVILALASCDSDAIYDNIQQYADRGGTLFPARPDTLFGRVGLNRVEIDLRVDGRIPASRIQGGMTGKTIVVIDEERPDSRVIVIDSIASWLSVDGLTEPRLYRFKVYVENEHGQRSMPVENEFVPFTEYDKELLALGILDPAISLASSVLLMEWPIGLHTLMLEYHGMKFSYLDADSELHEGTLRRNPRIFASNLPQGEEVIFDMNYFVLPIIDERIGMPLLDTIWINKPLVIQMPTPEQPFYPEEAPVLRQNGITRFTLLEADQYTELTYPMNMSTFSDLFYFNNVRTLDLTGKGLSNTLEMLSYSGNGMLSTVGGGAWQEYMMPMHQPHRIRENSGRSPDGLDVLRDVIESGQITKIRYIPRSMGSAFETFLDDYRDIVEPLTNDNDEVFPSSVFISPQFFVNGQVVNNTWTIGVAHSGDFFPRPGLTDASRFDPLNDVVNGLPVDLKLDQLIQSDGSNIYRITIRRGHASFFFSLPLEWRFDNQRYPYLKFKMFIGSEQSVFEGNRDNFRRIWLRFMNYPFSFDGQNDQTGNYGRNDWSQDPPWFDPAQIRNNWVEHVVSMSGNDGGDTSGRRNRIYVFNFGREAVGGGDWFDNDPNRLIIIYLADIRLSKHQNID